MEKSLLNKSLLRVFLLIGIAGSGLITSPARAMVAEEDDEEESQQTVWKCAQGFTDLVMRQIGGWPARTYAKHRYGIPYQRARHFGEPVEFSLGFRDNRFNGVDNVLKPIGVGRCNDSNVMFAAVRENEDVYALDYDREGKKVVEVSGPLTGVGKYGNLLDTFAYHTLLRRKKNDMNLVSALGDLLVTNNGQPDGQPVLYKGGLVFKKNNGTYVNIGGTKLTDEDDNELTEQDIKALPTIDAIFYPKGAVVGVLMGLAGSIVGTGLTVWKAFRWGSKTFFKKNKESNSSDNGDNTAVVTSKGDTSSGEKIGEKEAKTQQQSKKDKKQSHANSSVSPNAKNVNAGTKPTNVIPERPKIGKIAIVRITPRTIAAA